MDEDKFLYMREAIQRLADARDDESNPSTSIFEIINHQVGFLIDEDEAQELKDWFAAGWLTDGVIVQTPITDKQYTEMVDDMVSRLCGVSCGTAADVIIKYCGLPDISQRQIDRILTSLQ
jgi:hypothetical protein